MIDAYGKVIVSCLDDKIASVTYEIRMDELRSFRKKFPVLKDADSFHLYNK